MCRRITTETYVTCHLFNHGKLYGSNETENKFTRSSKNFNKNKEK